MSFTSVMFCLSVVLVGVCACVCVWGGGVRVCVRVCVCVQRSTDRRSRTAEPWRAGQLNSALCMAVQTAPPPCSSPAGAAQVSRRTTQAQTSPPTPVDSHTVTYTQQTKRAASLKMASPFISMGALPQAEGWGGSAPTAN